MNDVQAVSYAPLISETAATTRRAWMAHLCALVVAGVFFYAAAGKVWEPRQFAYDVKNYQILPHALLNLMAIFLPWWEVGAALALIVPRTRTAGAILVSAMLFMFITAVSYSAFYKGLNISCGCFRKGNPAAAGWKTIGLDTALLLGTWLSVWWLPRKDAPSDTQQGW